MPFTSRDVLCPVCCGEELTTHVALLPSVHPETKEHMDPHLYAVGPNCYRKQWDLAYPGEPCPLKIKAEKPPEGTTYKATATTVAKNKAQEIEKLRRAERTVDA